jgi:hypothetical protein
MHGCFCQGITARCKGDERVEQESEQPYEVRDPDLRAKLEGAAPITLPRLLKVMGAEQRRRDLKAADRAGMTAMQRRRDDAREIVDARDVAEDRHFIHSVLALCALPYRRPPDNVREFEREFGRSSLRVQAGAIFDPNTSKFVQQGLPYGPKPRLLMVHFCTMAMRNNSPEIEIEDSMSAFIRALGFEVRGGRRGTIDPFKEQLQRLAASRMQFGLWNPDSGRARTVNTQPIESFDLWLPKHEDQRTLWSSSVRLDDKFFDTLKRHALPVDVRILRAFGQSARQMDIIMWLGYRLKSIDRPLTIGWGKLQEQFGSDVHELRKFRQSFKEDWSKITDVFQKLPGSLDEDGLTLQAAGPDVLLLPQKRAR